MLKVVLPYYSGAGHTKILAEFVMQGLEMVNGVSSELMNVEDLNQPNWKKLHEANAIIFGSPTYMGNVSGVFKSFMDETGDFWLEQRWNNKIAAGFTVGTNASGDKLNSLVQMSIFAAQHGMIWVGQNHLGSTCTGEGQGINSDGAWLGLMATSDSDKSMLISKHDAQTAMIFGERVAQATARWCNQK